MAERLRIAHVSADYPDPIEPFKTPVIRRLIDLTSDEFDHHVISINRLPATLGSLAAFGAGKRNNEITVKPFEYGEALTYRAPGKGLLHKSMLDDLGERIADRIRGLDRPPDLLVAHKLTVEGIAVKRAAACLGIPYSLTIQGNTDRKIMQARPDLRPLFRAIYTEAKSVFSFTPVAREAMESVLGRRTDPIRLMPCPLDDDQLIAPRPHGANLVSVFHLKNHRVKNLNRLAKAAELLAGRNSHHSIDIIGGGSEAETRTCRRIASRASLIKFAGALPPSALRRRMNSSVAMVMPSLRESFGLVFIEALFSGLPIIYPAGTAIDGYFDGLPFAIRVNAHSPSEIAEAMQQAIEEEAQLKADLADWQHSSVARQFMQAEISKIFRAGIRASLL